MTAGRGGGRNAVLVWSMYRRLWSSMCVVRFFTVLSYVTVTVATPTDVGNSGEARHEGLGRQQPQLPAAALLLPVLPILPPSTGLMDEHAHIPESMLREVGPRDGGRAVAHTELVCHTYHPCTGRILGLQRRPQLRRGGVGGAGEEKRWGLVSTE